MTMLKCTLWRKWEQDWEEKGEILVGNLARK